ncbi:hypothetical protein Bca52824_080672 [Brassica carinata]|uniref:Uncharacterized protein n=1 Tax=Brassica carinata TaxID=52824 RepID=A0A8X7TSG4_BRACI|nr:hypothetical protein Bca52824_080672 [Brassica carinata]
MIRSTIEMCYLIKKWLRTIETLDHTLFGRWVVSRVGGCRELEDKGGTASLLAASAHHRVKTKEIPRDAPDDDDET